VTPAEVEYEPSTDWQRVTVEFDIEGDVTVGQDDHLRLRLWCSSDAEIGDCHLAYDTSTYRSSLLVREP
jgi:hypothetical protein